MHEIEVIVSAGTTAEDLHQRWTELSALRNRVSRIAQDKAAQWENATDPVIRQALWKEYEELFSHHQVVSGWADLLCALCTFSEFGVASEFLGDALMNARGNLGR